jgi:hypothetical protein
LDQHLGGRAHGRVDGADVHSVAGTLLLLVLFFIGSLSGTPAEFQE